MSRPGDTIEEPSAGGEAWLEYERLPGAVKDNLTAEQWALARARVVRPEEVVPDDAIYVNLKNGQMVRAEAGSRAGAPLLAVHNLAGGRGTDSTQFATVPEGAPEALRAAHTD